MKRKLPLLAALLCAAATGSAQTFTTINLNTPTAPAPAFAVGAVYAYPDAAPGVDAYVKVMRKTNVNTSGNPLLDSVTVAFIDNSAEMNGGYTESFQPVVSSSKINSSGLWTTTSPCGTGYVNISHGDNQDYHIHFRLYFKKAGTMLDTALNFRAAFIDIDGFGGSGTEAEQDAFMPGDGYVLDATTSLTMSQKGFLLNAQGNPANIADITPTPGGTVQVIYRNRAWIDFAMGMTTATASSFGGCYATTATGRLKSVGFDSAHQPTYPTPDTTNTFISLSGTVWHDANNSANGTFSSIYSTGEPGTSGGTTLYVYALDSVTGTVLRRATVSSSGSSIGTYTITRVPKQTPIRLLLSTANVAVGVTNGAPSTGAAPAVWVATSPLSRPPFRTGNSNVTGLDWGIQRPPTAVDSTLPTIVNPDALITVAGNAFKGTDLTPGLVDSIRFTGFPLNATQFRIGTTTYTSTTFPAAGVKVDANTAGNPAVTVQVKPVTGITTVSIPYILIDNGRAVSNTANVMQSYTSPPLSLHLQSFSGTAEAGTSALQWAVAGEEAADRYDVQWSTDARSWSTIGSVAATGAADYGFVHRTPAAGANFYRLARRQAVGSITTSHTVRVEHGSGPATFSFSPNPVRGMLSIRGGAAGTEAVLLDAAGKTVATLTLTGGTDALPVRELPAGSYLLVATGADGAVVRERVVKQ